MKTYQLKNGQILTIRETIKSDSAALIVFIQKITSETDFLLFAPEETSLSIKDEEAFIESFSCAENRIFLVAETEGKIVGVTHFEGGALKRIRHNGEIGLSVLEKYWGLGIGTYLLKFLIEWAQQTKIIRKINLRVHQDNTRAIKLYNKNGFRTEGQRTREFCINGKFYDIFLMGLEIN